MTRSVYLCGGRRTAIGRYGGSLATTRPDDMLSFVFSSLVDVFSVASA